MKLTVFYNKEALKREGDESVIYCSVCKSVIRIGIYRTLFCAKCESVNSEDVVIDSIMSCAHCEKPIAANMNFDGRITARCENENCGDCWSMQDLCLIKLNKSIEPVKGEDPYITHINNIRESEAISKKWLDLNTLDYSGLKKEILDCLMKTNPLLIRTSPSQSLINQALINAIEFNYQRLTNISTEKSMWHSITSLMKESGAKRDVVVSVFEKFLRESCSYEKRFYTKQQGRARFIHSDIYEFIMEQIKSQIDQDE